MRRPLSALVVAVLLGAGSAAGCGGEEREPDAPTSASTSAPGSTPGGGEPDATTATTAPLGEVALERVDVDLDEPVDVTVLGDSLLVAERAGVVRELVADGDGGYTDAGVIAELSDEVGSTDAEKGLLGVAVDPAGERMWVNHTRADDGATVIAEYTLDGGPGSLEATDRRERLVIDQPYPNHNGGDIVWGPDDHLYVGMGDGGSGGDPQGRAQRLSDPLGKILRLDPAAQDMVPADNPYVGDDDAEELVWARGVRNPWRMAFDPATGDLWLADVGQGEREEIDVLRAAEGTGRGADLEWDRREGDVDFDDPGPTEGWADDDAEVIEPVHTYGRDGGRCSIIGGFLHRGTGSSGGGPSGEGLSGLDGAYLFSDYCDGVVRAMLADGTVVDLGVSADAVVSINPDEQGRPLVLAGDGIHRLVPA